MTDQPPKPLNPVGDKSQWKQYSSSGEYLGTGPGSADVYKPKQDLTTPPGQQPSTALAPVSPYPANSGPGIANATYWNNPTNLGKWYDAIQGAQPGAEVVPAGMDAEGIKSIYAYIAKMNDGKPWTNWDKLPAYDDPVYTYLRSLPTPPEGTEPPKPPGALETLSKLPGQTWQVMSGDYQAMGMTKEQWDSLTPMQQWENRMMGTNYTQGVALGVGMGAMGGLKGIASALAMNLIPAIIGESVSKITPESPFYLPMKGVGMLASAAMTVMDWSWRGLARPVGMGIMGTEAALGSLQEAVTGKKPTDLLTLPEFTGHLYQAWELSDQIYRVTSWGSAARATDQLLRTVDPLLRITDIPESALREIQKNNPGMDLQGAIDFFHKTGNPLSRWENTPEVSWHLRSTEQRVLSPNEVDLNALNNSLRGMIYGGDSYETAVAKLSEQMGAEGENRQLIGMMGANLMPMIGPAAARLTGLAGGLAGFSKEFTDTMTEAKGPMEGMRNYGAKMRAIGGSPEEMAALPGAERWLGDHVFGTYSKEGVSKALEVSKPTNPLSKAWGYLTNLTPEARAHEVNEAAALNVVGIFNVEERDIRGVEKRVEGIAKNRLDVSAEMSMKSLRSPDAAALPLAFRSWLEKGTGKALITTYDTVNSWSRGILEKISKVNGKSIAENLQAFADLDDTQANVIARQLRDAAAASADPAGKGIVADYDAGKLTGKSLKEMFQTYIKNGQPFDETGLQAQYIGALFEHIEKWTATTFNVKPDPVWIRLGNTIKNGQGLLMLDLSPSFAIQNNLDNIIKISREGLFGLDMPGKVAEFKERFGIWPEQLTFFGGEAPGSEGMGAIAKAKIDPNSPLTKIDRGIRGIRRKVGIFSKISGSGENWARETATINGVKQAWGAIWKLGTGFDRMDRINPALERMLSDAGIDPNVVYDALGSSFNRAEVEKKIWQGINRRTVDDAIPAIARVIGKDIQEVRESFDKLGVNDFLTERLNENSTDADVHQAMQDLRKAVNDQIDTWQEARFKAAIEKAHNTFSGNGEGALGGLDLFDEAELDYTLRWLKGYDNWERVWELQGYVPSKQFGKMILEQYGLEKQAYQQLNKHYRANLVGMAQAMGVDDQISMGFEYHLMAKEDNLAKFYDRKVELLKSMDQFKDAKRSVWQSEWAKVKEAIKTEYLKTTEVDRAINAKVDGVFVELMRQSYGDEMATAAEAYRAGVRKINDDMVNDMVKFRDSIAGQKPRDRRAMWSNFLENVYRPKIVERMKKNISGAHDLYRAASGLDEAAAAKATAAGAGEEATPPPEPYVPTPAQEFVDKLRADLYKKSDDAIKATGAAKDANTAYRMTEPLMREQVKKAFPEYTPEQVDYSMEVVRAAARAWASIDPYTRTEAMWYDRYVAEVRSATPADYAIADAIGEPLRGFNAPLADGRALIVGFQGSLDITTFVHEMFHTFERQLEGEDARVIREWANGDDEKFAEAGVKYLQEGKIPSDSPGMAKVLKGFKNWITTLWDFFSKQNLNDPSMGVQISDEVRGVFDRLLADRDLEKAQVMRGGPPLNTKLGEMTFPGGMGKWLGDMGWEGGLKRFENSLRSHGLLSDEKVIENGVERYAETWRDANFTKVIDLAAIRKRDAAIKTQVDEAFGITPPSGNDIGDIDSIWRDTLAQKTPIWKAAEVLAPSTPESRAMPADQKTPVQMYQEQMQSVKTAFDDVIRQYGEGLRPTEEEQLAATRRARSESFKVGDMASDIWGKVNNRIGVELSVLKRLFGDRFDTDILPGKQRVKGKPSSVEAKISEEDLIFGAVDNQAVTGKRELTEAGRPYTLLDNLFKIKEMQIDDPWHPGTQSNPLSILLDKTIPIESLAEAMGYSHDPSLDTITGYKKNGEPKAKVHDSNLEWNRFATDVENFRHGVDLMHDDVLHASDKTPFFLGTNGKAGYALDFGLITCRPDTACNVCYAAGLTRATTVRKAMRNTILMLYDPEAFGHAVALETNRISKAEMPFVRFLGQGDVTTNEMIASFNTVAQEIDRPIMIFSRHHENLAQLQGTEVAPFIKIGSISKEIAEYYNKTYGPEYLVNNLLERGINNAFLYTSDADFPLLKSLYDQHAVGLIFTADPKLYDGLDKMMQDSSCPCDAHLRTYLGSCRDCALSNMGCWMMFADKFWNAKEQRMITAQEWEAGYSGDVVPMLTLLYGDMKGTAERWKTGKLPEDPAAMLHRVMMHNLLGKAWSEIAISKLEKMKNLIQDINFKKFEKGESTGVTLKDIRNEGDQIMLIDKDAYLAKENAKLAKAGKPLLSEEDLSWENELGNLTAAQARRVADATKNLAKATTPAERAKWQQVIDDNTPELTLNDVQRVYMSKEDVIANVQWTIRMIQAAKERATTSHDFWVRKDLEYKAGKQLPHQGPHDWLAPISEIRKALIETGKFPEEIHFQRMPQENTPEFNAWWRDSKAVDENGEPLDLYHGTDKEFDAFKGEWTYLTDNPDYANGFAGDFYHPYDPNLVNSPRVLKVHAAVPKVMDLRPLGMTSSPGEVYLYLHQKGGISRKLFNTLMENEGAGVYRHADTWKTMRWESGRIGWALKEAGYDAVVFPDRYNGYGKEVSGTSWVVFDPANIKSAWNSGRFSPVDPHILAQAMPDESNIPQRAVRYGKLWMQDRLNGYRDEMGVPREPIQGLSRPEVATSLTPEELLNEINKRLPENDQLRGEIDAYFAEQKKMAEENANLQDTVEKLKMDPLTNLPLARNFRPEIEGAGAKMFLDLTGMKWVNKIAAHAGGDEYLKTMAASIRMQFPGARVAFREGGDEFLIIFKDGDQARAAEPIIKQAIADTPIVFTDVDGNRRVFKGLPSYTGIAEGVGPESIKAADTAAVAAKKQFASDNPGYVSGEMPPGVYEVKTNEPQPPEQTTPPSAVGNAPPGTIDGLYDMDYGKVLKDGWESKVSPMMDELETQLTGDNAQVRNGVAGKQLPEDTSKALQKYLYSQYGRMADAKLATVRIAEQGRDQALLNYRRRYGFDNLLNFVMPYHFWFDRSAMRWLTTFIDKPQWLANYYYIRSTQYALNSGLNPIPGFPQRLNGKIQIPMPMIPGGWGGSIYVDPMHQLFGYEGMVNQFLRPLQRDQSGRDKEAQYIIQAMVQEGKITQDQATKALMEKAGPIWSDAYTQAQMSYEADIANPIDLVNSISSFSWPLQVAYQKYIRKTPNKIGTLPIFNTIQSLTSPFVPGGLNLGGWLNKALGAPERGFLWNYNVEREMANMAIGNPDQIPEILKEQTDQAGPLWDQAMSTVGKQTGVRQFASTFWGDFFPEGEQEQRKLQLEFYQAMQEGKGAAFFDAHPEYEARMMMRNWDNPEERMKQYLIGSIWNKLNAMPDLQRSAAEKQLGTVFNQAFLNKETRSYASLDSATLATWANQIQAQVPDTAPKTPNVGKLALPTDKQAADYQAFLTERDSKYPNVVALQGMYYKLPPAMQEKFMKQYPQLAQYWEARDIFIGTHPDMIPYMISEESRFSGLPEELVTQIYQYRAEKAQMFPDIGTIENGYYDQPNAVAKKAYLLDHPELKQYWDWIPQRLAQSQAIIPYVMSSSKIAKGMLGKNYSKVYQIDISKFDPLLVNSLLDYTLTGRKLGEGATQSIYQQWVREGKPLGSFDAYLSELMKQLTYQK